MKKVMALLVVLVLAIASIGCSRLFTITQTKYDISGSFVPDGEVDLSQIQVGIVTVPDTELTAGADHGIVDPDANGNWSKTGVWGTVKVKPVGLRPGLSFTPAEVLLTPEDNEAVITVRDVYFTASGEFTTDEEDIDFTQISLQFDAPEEDVDFDPVYLNADGTWSTALWSDGEITVTPQSIVVDEIWMTKYEPASATVSKDDPVANFEVSLIYAAPYEATITVEWNDEPLKNVWVYVGPDKGAEDLTEKYGDGWNGVLYTDNNGEVVVSGVREPFEASIATPGIVGEAVTLDRDNNTATISVEVEYVWLPNANLETAIRELFGKAEGAITPADFNAWMASSMPADKSIDFKSKKITDIEGMQWFTEVERMRLYWNNQFDDLRPLSYHPNLYGVYMHRGWYNDAGPMPKSLAPLMTIPTLRNINISHIDSYESLLEIDGAPLTTLSAQGRGSRIKFSNMAEAPYLPELTLLDRRYDDESFDLTGIADKFPKLEEANFEKSVIPSVRPLIDLEHLTKLTLSNCGTQDGYAELVAAKPTLTITCK